MTLASVLNGEKQQFYGQTVTEVPANLSLSRRAIALLSWQGWGIMRMVCMYCGRFRNEDGRWQQKRELDRQKPDSLVTHGICTECFETTVSPMLRQRQEAAQRMHS